MHRPILVVPRVLVFFAGIALGACTGGGGAATLDWRTVTDTIGDTVVVRTVGASDSAAALRLVEELRIGQADGPDEYTFAAVLHLAPAADGGVYVWDQALRVLRQYGADGRYVRQIGRSGRGPGEYQASFGLHRLRDGRLAFSDQVNGRILFYDSAGRHVGEWRTARPVAQQGALHADTAGRLYQLVMLDSVSWWGRSERPQGYAVHAADGTVVDTIVRPVLPRRPGLSFTHRLGSRTIRGTRPVPFAPEPLHAFSPHGHFVSGDGERYAVTLHRTGAPPLRIERDVAAPPVAPGERDEVVTLVTANTRELDPGWRWSGPDVPETKPFFRELQVGADGRIWVTRSMPAERVDPPADDSRGAIRPRWQEPVAYDVFEPDGRFVGHLAVPRRTSLRYMDGAHAWGVARDSLDVPYVVRFRLERVVPPTE